MEKKASTLPAAQLPAGKAPTATMPMAPMPMMQMPMAQMPMAQMPAPAIKPMEKHEMKSWCHDHMHRYVLAHTKDGLCCDGFVEHIDDDMVCIAVPHCEGQWDPRAFLPYPHHFPRPPLYPYPYYPRRRFFRQVFPLAALFALTLLPFY